MKLHGILHLGNDKIIPSDVRDFGNIWGSETQVMEFDIILYQIMHEIGNSKLLNALLDNLNRNFMYLNLGCCCPRYWDSGHE